LSINQLCFSGLTEDRTDEGFKVTPSFKCPMCKGKAAASATKIPSHVKVSAYPNVFASDGSVDANKEVTFTMPCCGAKITLHHAVHREKGKYEVMHCMSREPIPADWWVMPKMRRHR